MSLLLLLLLAQGTARDARIADALDWLARHRNEDGSWSVQGWVGRCGGKECGAATGKDVNDLGVTALATLAFLHAGVHPTEKTDAGRALDGALDGLVKQQQADGLYGRVAEKQLYGHAVATYAMAEAVRIAPDDIRRQSLTRAAGSLMAARSPTGGWRYVARDPGSDTSVTAWALHALHAARQAGEKVHDMKAAFDWLDSVTEENHARVGYTHRGTGKVFVPGGNEHFEHHETLTAAAELCRLVYGRKAHPQSAGLLLKDLPKSDAKFVDSYYWYYGTRYLKELKSERAWESWRSAAVKVLTDMQVRAKGGCRNGTWETGERWSCEAGRVYVTAINTLTLCALTGVSPAPSAPKPGPNPPAEPKPAVPARFIIKLKNGGQLKAVSCADDIDHYEVKLAGGMATRIAKADVESIEAIK